MSATPLPNQDMPWLRWYWKDHVVRVGRLTLEERGVYCLARCELATVERCRMPLDTLKARMRAAPDSAEARGLDTLIALGVLSVDAESWVFDADMTKQFDGAVAEHNRKVAAGRNGGRAKARNAATGSTAQSSTTSPADDF